jgi:hypothetical protein
MINNLGQEQLENAVGFIYSVCGGLYLLIRPSLTTMNIYADLLSHIKICPCSKSSKGN